MTRTRTWEAWTVVAAPGSPTDDEDSSWARRRGGRRGGY